MATRVFLPGNMWFTEVDIGAQRQPTKDGRRRTSWRASRGAPSRRPYTTSAVCATNPLSTRKKLTVLYAPSLASFRMC